MSAYPAKPVYVHDFVVVNFNSKHLSPEVRAWKESAKAIAAESCSRQVWYGLKEDFVGFPDKERPGINFFEGKQAYDFMLRLYSGLESVRLLEDSIKGQICGSWESQRDLSPAKQKAIDTIMQHIKADHRFVNAAVLRNYQPYRHEISARDLSGQKKSDVALIVGSVNRHNHAGQFTDGIARVIGNKRPGRVSQIIVTHPDSRALNIIHDALSRLKTRGIVDCRIVRMPFEDLGKSMEVSDRVFVDLPMGSIPDAEEEIALHWMSRMRQDNILVHMRGNPQLQGGSTELWQQADLDNYIAPEDIRADMIARGRANKAVLQKAKEAIAYCAELRGEGKSPSNAKVKAYVESGPTVKAA